MRLPSLQQALQESGRTLKRFPFVLGCSVLGTLVTLILIDYQGTPTPSILFRILFGAILGLPVLTAFALIAEKRAWGKSAAMGAQLLGVFLLAIYTFSVPLDLMHAPMIHVQRLVMLILGFCGLVVVGPFLQSGQLNAFWHYGKTLFFRVLLAALYSGTLQAGLAIALAALDNLFGINVPPRRYAELWFLILGVFAMWFFLAGVPENLDRLEEDRDYPKGIKVFAQYVLLPLLLVYLVILYAYLAKIVIQWNWPQGWVSRLTLCFAGAGIATLLLLHPIREKTENLWIKAVMRWFWVIMIPPVIMLMLAIIRRISEYGITEGRYVGFVLGIWLACMVVYFTFSRAKSIKFIPGSLGALSLLISFGPWGAFEVSQASQINRLHEILIKNEILAGSKVQRAPATVSTRDAVQISSIISYLREVHGYDGIQGWFAESLAQDSAGAGRRLKEPADVTAMMGVEYLRDQGLSARHFLEVSADTRRAIDAGGYQHLMLGQRYNPTMPHRADSTSEMISRIDSSLNLTFVVMDHGRALDSLQVGLRQWADTLLGHYDESRGGNVAPEKMSIVAGKPGFRIKVCMRSIQFRNEGSGLRPFAYDADILYSLDGR